MRKALVVIGLLLLVLSSVACNICGLSGESAERAADEVAAVETPEPTTEATATIKVVTASELDEAFGEGNWGCFSDSNVSVYANMVTTYTVSYPVSSVDMTGTRYGEGETVPAEGAATVWLQGEIARSQCPLQIRIPVLKDVCTVEDLSEYGEVEVLDADNGAARVTAESIFVVPSGWTVDFQGTKYTSGMIVPSGPATWWAPGNCKPLE